MALAIDWRKKPEYHRRLVFIATCELMDVGIGRFDFWFNHSIFYAGLDCLILLGVVRDLVVDRRVSKVYLYALPDRRPNPQRLYVERQSGMVAEHPA